MARSGLDGAAYGVGPSDRSYDPERLLGLFPEPLVDHSGSDIAAAFESVADALLIAPE